MAAIVFVGDRELRSITPMSETKYRVVFQNNGQVVELYVKSIYQSDLYGFIEVEEYLFGQKSSVVLDPTEDKLRSEFANVKRSYIPMQHIIRIDEVEHVGQVKSVKAEGGATVSVMPPRAKPIS
jgi:hypothetical protein